MLSSQPWVERLGWTLIHFLWQGLAIAVLYVDARGGVMARWSSPHARYLLACAALAAMMAAPLVTWELMRPSDASPDAAYRIRSNPPAAVHRQRYHAQQLRCPLPSAPRCPTCSRHRSCLGS